MTIETVQYIAERTAFFTGKIFQMRQVVLVGVDDFDIDNLFAKSPRVAVRPDDPVFAHAVFLSGTAAIPVIHKTLRRVFTDLAFVDDFHE